MDIRRGVSVRVAASAWWRELGLVSGDFTLAGDATNMLLKNKDPVSEDLMVLLQRSRSP